MEETKSHQQVLQQIIDRWKLRVERMDDSNYFVYGVVGPAKRILFLVWSEMMRINGANDYIDIYLKETDPTLAAQMLEDISQLVQGLDDLDSYRFHT